MSQCLLGFYSKIGIEKNQNVGRRYAVTGVQLHPNSEWNSDIVVLQLPIKKTRDALAIKKVTLCQ